MYRRRPGSVTQTNSLPNLRDSILADLFVFDFIEDRIPEIFTTEHLKKCLQMSLVLFLRSPQDAGDEWKRLRERLEKKIAELENKIGIENCSPLLRIAYWMFWHCRGLLTVAYRYAWAPVRGVKRCMEIIRG